MKGRHCHYFQEIVQLRDGDEITIADCAYGERWRDLFAEPLRVELDTRMGHLCRMLGNRRVLYIGDSTAHEAASTLMNSFRPAGETCQTQITFALSDTLIGGNYGASNRGRRWTTAVDVVRPDIIILSVGAHIVSYRSSL